EMSRRIATAKENLARPKGACLRGSEQPPAVCVIQGAEKVVMAQLMRGEGIYPHGDEVTSRLQAVKVAAPPSGERPSGVRLKNLREKCRFLALMMVLDEPLERPLFIEKGDQRGGRDPVPVPRFALQVLPRLLEQLLDPAVLGPIDFRRPARRAVAATFRQQSLLLERDVRPQALAVLLEQSGGILEPAIEQRLLMASKEIAEGEVLLQKKSDRIRARFEAHDGPPGA